jgi:hypothetical protein
VLALLAAACFPEHWSVVDTSGVTRLSQCAVGSSHGGDVVPSSWSLGCTGGSLNTHELSWSKWTANIAIATGEMALLDYAAGTTYFFPAEVRAFRPRLCRNTSYDPEVDTLLSESAFMRYFTRVTITQYVPEDHPSGRPPGAQPTTVKLGCTK